MLQLPLAQACYAACQRRQVGSAVRFMECEPASAVKPVSEQDDTIMVVSLATERGTEQHRDLSCSLRLSELMPDSSAEPYAHARRFCHQLGERKR